jgi:hypothetical protein
MLSLKARRPDILVQMICAPVLARSGIRVVREIGRSVWIHVAAYRAVCAVATGTRVRPHSPVDP